ncbi:coiled-coil domain-containing protein 180 isoform X2 [Mastacembelus armatus]|uniref:coiled-coil domain-containing protein 180 isoform X2 n=1 Tax=Mastacembelus armatus TaxID=205130 RepID=UPI000E462A6E|nr:coiled-coil domain-containing protein 180-like isoform X2 [Mastacembelus armatus]
MCARAVPSRKVYRQLFDAQVQLSRCLLAGTRTNCQSAEDSNTHCSSASRGQRLKDDGDDDDVYDVSRLPDAVVVGHPGSDIVQRLMEKRRKKHEEALKQLDAELTELSQVCETQVRSASEELLSSLEEVDLRLDTLKRRMERLDHASLQEVCGLWEQAEEKAKLKKIKILELNHKLSKYETQRTDKVRAVLRKYCQLLENISFLLPPDVHRLIHTEATKVNQSLLANRRSTARLLLLLQEKNLQQESLLRLHWERCLNCWKMGGVREVIDRFRILCSSDEQPQLSSLQMKHRDLMAQRCDIIYNICSLVPPSCSTTLVSDWFNQLTSINQQIDGLHGDFLHQLRCCYEQMWQDRLAEVERCKEALSALQLSEEEVNHLVSSELLTLIGQIQSRDEERLAALDVGCDLVTHHTLSLSRSVFVLMSGAALLWVTHSCKLERREEELQQQLDNLKHSQQQHIQKKMMYLDDLISGLRQGSNEDTMKRSLDKTVCCLEDIKQSCRQCVSGQWEVLDCLPSHFLEELLSYSSSLSAFYHLDHSYTPHELVNQQLNTEGSVTHTERTVHADQPCQDWLNEAESSLLQLCDISCSVKFTSSKGEPYAGPAFTCPSPNLPDNLQQETHLRMFPVEVLTQALSRTRTLFLDHLEQHFHDVLSSAATMVTDRKGAVSSEQELQLQHLDIQYIQTHIYQPRLAELQLHRQRVDVHCDKVQEVLTSCRTELQELQTSIRSKNTDFSVTLSNMEGDVMTANSSHRLEAVSSTLHDCLDRHIKDTQCCQTTFRQTVHTRLEEARNTTRRLLSSFRLFSEGGNFAPQEMKVLQGRLKEIIREITVTEESICSELEAFESKSLEQVKEASDRLEEKLSFIRSEVKFMEKIEKIISSTRVHIRAEAANSNQQQSVIGSRLGTLKRMLENTQVSPDQVFSILSLLNEEISKRCQYLDYKLDTHLHEDLIPSDPHKYRKQVRSAPVRGLQQPSRTDVDLFDDPVVGIIRSLNKVCTIQDATAEKEERGTPAAGQSPVQRLQQKSAVCVSMRRSSRSIRNDRRFQVFGHKPETELNMCTFSSTVKSELWKTNDILLLLAEDFYTSKRLGRSQLLPDAVDQWVENMQQRLLGYQQQARRFLSMSTEELENQLSALEKLLQLLPSVLIRNHERQQEVELEEAVDRVRKNLEETLAASEKEKSVNIRRLRVSLSEDELQTLNSREELRQQQLHSAICCSHLELQECLRIRGEEFVTSLASLTEQLFCHLDHLLTPAGTDAAVTQQHSEDSVVTMETGSELRPRTGNGYLLNPHPHTQYRTLTGIPNLMLPTNSTVYSRSSVTTATAASITTARCTLGHLAVIEQRDVAVKRFEQLSTVELSRSDDDKRRQTSELQSWSAHWRSEIYNLKHRQQHSH